jgi:sialidase-1
MAPALFLANQAAAAEPDPAAHEQSDLFTAGVGGYHTYRIPALIVTAKGSVLAFCEGRKTGGGDHGDLDLVMKRSTDGGRTWSDLQIVHEEGGDAKITIGNPCPAVDRATGTIWLPFCRDNKRVLLASSTDDGQTWSKPRDISDSVTRSDWAWVATGPGIGIQLTREPHAGRIVIPCDHRLDLANKQQEWNSHMMYSDDSGKTWQISTPIQAGGNECQVVERTDGSLLVNTRMQGHFAGFRGIATSTDGGATWSSITPEKQLPGPQCEASFLRESWPTTAQPGRLLFSNPFPPEAKDPAAAPSRLRKRLTIRESTDDGKTWPVAKRLNEGFSAYSSLAVLPDGTILCLYETGYKKNYEVLRLARFSRKWLETP